MTPIPEILREAMTDFGMAAVDRWWDDLSESARADVITLWRSVTLEQMGVVRVNAQFVDAGESVSDSVLWHDDFYEYLVNHEVFLLDPHPYHICTQHPAARAAVRAGFVPSDFVCPLAPEDCPMRQLLQYADGKSVRLRLAFVAASHP